MSRTHVRMNKDDRRARIVAAAIEIIGDQGFRSFSIRNLAVRCDMTDAGLLHHFGSKTGLLTAVLDERDRQDALAVAAALGDTGDQVSPSREATRRILHKLVQCNGEQPELLRLYAMLRVEALASDHPAHAYFRDRDAMAQRMFGDLVAAFAENPSELAREIIAALDGLELRWLCEGQGFDLVEAWDSLAAKLLA
jgi:AcrR family transcriptional regulator